MKKLQLVRVRRARWTVTEVVPHEGCAIVTLTGAEPSSYGRTLRVLTPFDDVDPIVAAPRPRRMRRSRWRRACRALIGSEIAPGHLRSAAGARMDVLPHQLEPALAIVRGLGCRALLADDVGLGKTIQAGLILSELIARQAVERALVLAPSGLRDQWAGELCGRFGIDAVTADAARLRRLASALPLGLNPWITLPIAIASLDYVKRGEVLPAVAACQWDVLIVDEAHTVAGDSDRRTAVEVLAGRASYVVLLSATPHSGDERAFTNLCAVGEAGSDDPLLLFRRTRREIRPEAVRRIRVLQVRPAAAECRLFAALNRYRRAVVAEHGSRALALSVLDKRTFSSAWALAESVDRHLAQVDSPEAAEHQLQLPLEDPEGELGADDSPPAWPADLALTDRRHERQLLATLLAAARQAIVAGESKIAALSRLLRRAGEPALIFTEYRDTAAHLQAVLGRGLLLHGGLNRAERSSVLAAFAQRRGELLIATDAAGQGLNLQHACRLVVNLELPWNPMRLEQRIGRVDRIGQSRRVHAIHLVGRETGEQQMLDRLQARIATARAAAAAPDPLGVSDDQGIGMQEAGRLVRPELSRDGVAETARVKFQRAVMQPSDQQALIQVETAPWWVVRSRPALRARLGGRSLFIYRLSIDDALGVIIASRVVAIAWRCPTSAFVNPPPIAEAEVQSWVNDVTAAASMFWRVRRHREHTIASRVNPHDDAFQAGLFDRRLERLFTEAAACRREARESLQQRQERVERQSELAPAQARLLLMMQP